MSSTDAAAVFSVLRVLPLPRRVAGLLEAESGFNDAPAVILVLMFSAMPFVLEPGSAVADLVYELAGGCRDRVGAAVSRCPRAAAHRAAGVRPLPDRDLRVGHRGVRRRGHRPRQRVHRRLPGGGGAGQLRTAAPVGDPVVRRRTRLAGADRSVRAARPAGDAQRTGGRRGARRSSSGWCCCWSPGRSRCVLLAGRFPRSRGASRCSCRGRACAVRSRSCWRRSRSSRESPNSHRLLNIVFILVVVFTLVQGPSLRPIARGSG